MQVSTFNAFQLSIKVIELPKFTKFPTLKTPQHCKELIIYEYKLIEKRLGKKLAAKAKELPPIINDYIPSQQ